jgi:hypothetical protein
MDMEYFNKTPIKRRTKVGQRRKELIEILVIDGCRIGNVLSG